MPAKGYKKMEAYEVKAEENISIQKGEVIRTTKTPRSQLNASKEYEKVKDIITFRVDKGWKAIIEDYANNQGKSVNALLVELLQKEITDLPEPIVRKK